MTPDERDRIAADTERLLEQAIRGALRETQDYAWLRKCQKRRWCGLSVMISALLCLSFASALWPAYGQMERYLWIVFSLLLFLFGIYQIDQASKAEDRGKDSASDGSTPRGSIRIVR